MGIIIRIFRRTQRKFEVHLSALLSIIWRMSHWMRAATECPNRAVARELEEIMQSFQTRRLSRRDARAPGSPHSIGVHQCENT